MSQLAPSLPMLKITSADPVFSNTTSSSEKPSEVTYRCKNCFTAFKTQSELK
jgi:hypothetical protein